MEEKPDSTNTDPAVWEKYLESVGLGRRLKRENPGTRIEFGKSRVFGVKSEAEEILEDEGGHGSTCPIEVGVDLEGKLNQPNERPAEDEALENVTRQQLRVLTGGARRRARVSSK